MIAGRPSATALRAATFRAQHQLLDRPLVFADPLATRILEPMGPLRTPPRASPVRAFAAARSRHAEELLAKARLRGCTQYVILGAGLDTFAYRGAHAGLRVFEIDHPDTQAWKRSLLDEAGIEIPRQVTHVPVDFARQALVPELMRAGFAQEEPAFFSWLGVTPYLRERAVLETLTAIRALDARGEIVFDYLVPRSELSWRGRIAHFVIERYVARLGEPILCYFSPDAIRERLLGFGYGQIDDLDCPALNALYFDGRKDGLRVPGRIARIVHART